MLMCLEQCLGLRRSQKGRRSVQGPGADTEGSARHEEPGQKAACRGWGGGNVLQKRGGERTRFSLPNSEKWRTARRAKAEDRMSPKAGEEQKEPLLEQREGCGASVQGSREMGQREVLPTT